MPSDDLVLSVRQVAGYPPIGNAPPTGLLLIQLGLGGAYQSISPQALVSTALAGGGDMAIAGALTVQSVSSGSAQFSNAVINMFSAQKACIVDFAATWGTVGGVQIATINDLAAQYAASVNSFNGRVGNVRLWIDDIICAGGAPIFSPRFQGSPRAGTPPPTSNSSRLATTAFVAQAVGSITGDFAPIDSPNFTGVPTAPTPALGSSDGQLATTAFVMNAVSESTTGVSSFNTRTGAVVLASADLTAAGGALLASPALAGTPSAPTAAPGTNTTQLATTAYVMAAVSGVTSGVSSFNTRTGAVTLTSADLTAAGGALLSSTVASFNARSGAVNLLANDISAASGALLASPAFTGTPTAPTPTAGDSSTRIATTAFVASFSGFAPLASPAFTGIPTAPTATVGTNTTQLATTAFVLSEIVASTSGVATFNGRSGDVTLLANDITSAGGALLASPALTGTPSAPTAAPGTNTTQLSTTAFVTAGIAALAIPAASTTTPLMDGTAAVGTGTTWARNNHVHPSDTSRAALAGAAFTGGISTPGPIVVAVNGALGWDATNGTSMRNNTATPSASFALLNPSGSFVISGAGYQPGGGTWNAVSDARIKTVEGDYEHGLDEVLKLAPVVYRYKGNEAGPGERSSLPTNKSYIGLIAQAVEPVFPEMVHDGVGYVNGSQVADLKSLDTGPLIYALVNAIKTLADRVTNLEEATR